MGGHFISYSGRVFSATPDDDMEHVYEENQNETDFEFVHVSDFSDYSLSDGVLSQQIAHSKMCGKITLQLKSHRESEIVRN